MAKVLLSVLCGGQGLATLLIDLTRTHATNPHWSGHARFHVVWQSFQVALLSLVEIVLIWNHGPFARQAFYLVLVLAAVSPMGFLIALAGRRLYGGTLSDPNGIAPLRFNCAGRAFHIDLNLVAVLAALLVLGGIVIVDRIQ